jgi:hypothetical protein
MIRRLAVCILIVLSLVAILPIGVSAQDASPSASPPARDFAMLSALGLPQIDLVATDTDITGAPSEVTAGRYLVTLDNRTADQQIQVDFVVPPAEVSQEQAWTDLTAESEEPFAWFYNAIWAGGPNAAVGQTDGVVVELAAGAWMLTVDRSAATEVPPKDAYSALQVTGELPLAREIAGAVPVNLKEFTFEFPATMMAGPQIWKVTNTGKQPHFLDLVGVPPGTTFEQGMEFISSYFTGTPAASILTAEDLRDIYSAPSISSGQSQWIQVNLEPGTYAVACFIPDQDTGAPHALMGMIQVFTVS